MMMYSKLLELINQITILEEKEIELIKKQHEIAEKDRSEQSWVDPISAFEVNKQVEDHNLHRVGVQWLRWGEFRTLI